MEDNYFKFFWYIYQAKDNKRRVKDNVRIEKFLSDKSNLKVKEAKEVYSDSQERKVTIRCFQSGLDEPVSITLDDLRIIYNFILKSQFFIHICSVGEKGDPGLSGPQGMYYLHDSLIILNLML